MNHAQQWRRNKAEAEKSLRYAPHQAAFTKEQLARMFSAREAGVTDKDIATRFGISAEKLARLIGRRVKP